MLKSVNTAETTAADEAQQDLTDGFHLVIDALKLNGLDTIYGVPGIPISDLGRMTNNTSQGAGPSHKVVESGITILIALFGVIVIIGSIQAGIDWGAEGPRAGFFPFYLGVIIVISSAINLRNEIRGGRPGLFAEWSQLRQVMRVVIPTTLYVGTMPYIGLYVGSTVLIACARHR